jgi:hypothetical protein
MQQVALVASLVAYLRKTYPKIDGVWVVIASLVCGMIVYGIEHPANGWHTAMLSGLKLGLGAVGAVTLGRYMLDKREVSGNQVASGNGAKSLPPPSNTSSNPPDDFNRNA